MDIDARMKLDLIGCGDQAALVYESFKLQHIKVGDP